MRSRVLMYPTIGACLAVFASAAVCGSSGSTPTPTELMVTAAATTAPTPAVTAFPPTAVFPTPKSSTDTMIVGGNLWVDGKPATGEVLALIGGKVCGRNTAGFLPLDPAPSNPVSQFVVAIESDAVTPGCGTPGAPVTLTVDGRAMDVTIPWQPGFQQPVTLHAGEAP